VSTRATNVRSTDRAVRIQSPRSSV
jgi:hypothetical protein